MRTLVQIAQHKGYVDIPIENNVPNPYAVNFQGRKGQFVLMLEISEDGDFQIGKVVEVVFKYGQVQILEES